MDACPPVGERSASGARAGPLPTGFAGSACSYLAHDFAAKSGPGAAQHDIIAQQKTFPSEDGVQGDPGEMDLNGNGVYRGAGYIVRDFRVVSGLHPS